MRHLILPARSPRGLRALLLAVTLLLGGTALAQTPPQDSLPIRITPDERTLQRGDVLFFTVEVVNTSTIALLRDGTSGGTALQLALPEGMGYVLGSGRIELVGGQVVRALDPAIERKEPRLVQDRDGNPQTLNLGAGQGLRFTYQLRVLPKAKPYTATEHKAWLVTADGTRLSGDAVARLRVEPDPELDLAQVLGQVFCDQDGDGLRDAGERGVGGVRVAADTGRVVDTDADGRFHLRDFRPGAHLVKVDVHTLPPGSKPKGDTKRLFDLTGGLIARHDFAVTCTTNVQRPSELVLAGESGPLTPVEASSMLMVRGNANGLVAAWEGFSAKPRKATLLVEADQMTSAGKRERVRALNLPWRPGQLGRSITFFPGLEGEPIAPKNARWQLEVSVVDGALRELVHVFQGRGLPPERLSWEGLDPEGAVGVMKRGLLHEARLVLIDGEGERLESAPVVLGASWSASGQSKELGREIVRDNLLSKTDEPTGKLMGLLKRAGRRLAKTPGARMLVEVHVGPSGNDDADLVKTRRAAFNLAVFARKELGLASDRFFAMGFGSTRPLRPNITDRNKAFNSRVEIVILPPEDERALEVPTPPVMPAQAFVQGEPVEVDPTGAFLLATPRADAMALALQASDGSRRTVVLGLVKAPGLPEGVDEHGALKVPGAKDAGPAQTPEEATPAELASDPLRRFGGQALREALGPGNLVVGGDEAAAKVTADRLEIELPPKDSVLASPRLFLRGQTHPKNVVTVLGQPLTLDTEGRFAQLVTLPSDVTSLLIESKDPAGNVARLAWPVKVKDTELFLLALVDGVGGQLGARLEELDSYDKTDNGSLFLAGRGALYAKGRVSGTALAKDLFVTAHVDTTRTHEFSAFYDQVIDPTRDYVLYGDATDDMRDANARGRFYIMVEADKSKLSYGSFRTDIRGLHLLRYDRTFDGAKLDFDKELADGFRTRVKGYLADDNRRLVRRHDELRATGGSLYYLSSREILEGSDKVELVVRELDTGLELGRTTLTRDVHYRVDYPSGRVMTMGPISSVVDPLFQIAGYQPFTGRAMLDGHEIWLDVDYESRAVQAAGDLAYGVHATQELFGKVEVGGGYLREGRPAGAAGGDTDYVLWGVQAKVKLTESSRVYAEYAENKDKDGATRVSTDGGLGYRDLDRAPGDNEGTALRLGMDLDFGELLKDEHLDLRVKAHWQLLNAGYHAVGLASEEGTEKWGGEIMWRPSEDGRLHLRYDGGTTLTEDPDFEDGLRAVVRNRWLARYDHDVGAADVYGELSYGQHRDDLDGRVFDTTAASVGTVVRLGQKVRLFASQEALFGGDDAVLGAGYTERLTTNIGADFALSDDLAFRIGQSVRWNGDNATRLGFTTKLAEGARAYFEERIQPGDRNGRVVGSTVLGAEHTLGRDGRVYTEYRLDGGVGGRTNRAVMGIGRSLELAPGIKAMLAYERSQVMESPDVLRRGSRDVLSGGLELKHRDWLRFGGLYEVRWDRDQPPTAEYAEVLQAVARNTLDLKLGEDVTLLALFNYMLSQDLETRDVAREDVEATLGLAFRPLGSDDLVLVAKYSRLLERRAETVVSLLGEALRSDDRHQRDLLSVAAIIELPWNLRLTEKLVWRLNAIDATTVSAGDEDLLLWLNRLGVDLWQGLELAGEFRLLASLDSGDILKNGGLVELSFTFLEHARLGIGWAMDGYAGGLLPGEEDHDIDNGFYVRMTGTY